MLSGAVELAVWPVRACEVRDVARWHLNAEKGDRFVFEDRPQRVRATREPGAVLNPTECAEFLAGSSNHARATACAITEVVLLVVPFSELTAEVQKGFFRKWLMSKLQHQPQLTRQQDTDRASAVAALVMLESSGSPKASRSRFSSSDYQVVPLALVSPGLSGPSRRSSFDATPASAATNGEPRWGPFL